jgi:hypothetical protein
MLLSEVGEDKLALDNRDFDTGKPTCPGEYSLADNTFSELAIKIADQDPAKVDAKVVKQVLDFYQDLNQAFATRADSKQWDDTMKALARLRAAAPASGAAVPEAK